MTSKMPETSVHVVTVHVVEAGELFAMVRRGSQTVPEIRVGDKLYTADQMLAQMRAMYLAGLAAADKIIERLRRDMQKINDDCDGENHLNVSCDALDAIGAYRNNLTALEQEAQK